MRVQAKYKAPCTYRICNFAYNASEGYKFPECFEKHGGISDPNETKPCPCIHDPLTTTPSNDDTWIDWFFIVILCILVFLFF